MRDYKDWEIESLIDESFLGSITGLFVSSGNGGNQVLPEKYLENLKATNPRLLKTLAFGLSNEDRLAALKELLRMLDTPDRMKFMTAWKANAAQTLQQVTDLAKRVSDGSNTSNARRNFMQT